MRSRKIKISFAFFGDCSPVGGRDIRCKGGR